MNLVDMKLPKESKEELKRDSYSSITEGEQDRWPYGLQLRFETEQVEKLPILKTFVVGDKITVMGEATVTEVRMAETQTTMGKEAKTQHTIELQVESVDCEKKIKKAPEKMNPKEYRNMREKE